MDKKQIAKLATAATIMTGMAIALPAVTPFVAPFLLPLVTGMLSDKVTEKLGESSVTAVTGILSNLASSAIWEAPTSFGKTPENHDLLKLLANAYSKAIDELLKEIENNPEDNKNYGAIARLVLPEIKKEIDKALKQKQKPTKTLDELFPSKKYLEAQKANEENPQKVPFYLKLFGYSPKAKVPISEELAGKLSSEDFILSISENPETSKEILAHEVEISLRRWFAKTTPSVAEFPESLTPFVFKRLAEIIPKYVGTLIKEEGFEKSWLAFQRSHLQAILIEVKNKNNGLSDEDREMLRPLAEKLDKLAKSDFPRQLTDITSQILLRLDESEENIKKFIAEQSAKLTANFADLLRGTETRLSDKIETGQQENRELSQQTQNVVIESTKKIIEAFSASQAATPERIEERRRDAENSAKENQLRQKHEPQSKPIPNPIPNAHDVFDRRDECAKLAELLVAKDTRLIRVVAPSGYGKTKLVAKFLQSVAANIGERNGKSAADGVLFVDCKRLEAETNRGTADIWNEILDRAGWMLGKRGEFNDEIRRIQSPSGQAAHLLEALEAAGKFWLILDNFEDLLDKESGTIGKDADDPVRHLFHQLCTDATRQRLIITTQRVPVFIGKNAPRLSDKHLLEVGGTPETDAVNYLKTEGEPYLLKQINEAVLLDFARRVDCLPLAVISLLRDLEKHFRGKPRGRVTVAEVEAIVQSATHYVETDKESGLRLWLTEQIAKLHADEQIVLSVLSVFGKPCPQTALEFILPNVTADKIERLLARLERDKLLYQEGAGFQLSAIIRDAAYSLIPDGSDNEQQPTNGQNDFNKKALQTQAADFYATQCKPQAEWKSIADIQPQLDEIQHRIYAEEFETAADVLYEIDFNYLFLWGNYRLLIELREQLQDKLPENSVQVSVQANSLGLAYSQTGRVRQSIEQFEKTLQIAQSTDDKQNEGLCLGNLGTVYDSLGEYQKAIEYHEQSLEISREISNRLGEDMSLNNLGLAYNNLGEYRKAIEYYKQSLAIFREIGNRRGESKSLGNLGSAYGDLGEYQKAIEYFKQYLEISREIGEQQGEGNSLGNLGLAYSNLGEKEKACGMWKEALVILEAIESPVANSVRQWIEEDCN